MTKRKAIVKVLKVRNEKAINSIKQYKNIYSKSIFVNGKCRKINEVFSEQSTHEIAVLLFHKYIKEADKNDVTLYVANV
jgi:hypothetical protein